MSALTHVFRCISYHSLRAMALRLIPSLSWRHHGIGVLQGYIAEDTDPEIRLHIWHPDLIKSGMDKSGDIHDHRFDLVSHVLVGAVVQDEIFAEPGPGGDHTTLILTHARAAKDNAYYGPTVPTGERFFVRSNPIMVTEGHSYKFPARHFHRSPLTGQIAVSCVEKYNQSDIPARVLHPVALEPVMAFGHDMDYGLVTRIIAEAIGALERVK